MTFTSSCANLSVPAKGGLFAFLRKPTTQLVEDAWPLGPQSKTTLAGDLIGDRGAFCLEAAMNTLPVICDNCGKVFQREPRRIERSRNQFCSHPCYAQWLIRRQAITCDHCGITFMRQRSEIARNNKHFCGKACALACLNTSVTKPCAHCGKPVIRGAGDMRKQRRGVFVCDAACRKAYFVGNRHPRWRGGPGQRYGVGWNKAKRLVLARDSHRCVVCGIAPEQTGKEPDVHHLQPFRSKGGHSLNNLVCLCRKHHRQAEWGKLDLAPYITPEVLRKDGQLSMADTLL